MAASTRTTVQDFVAQVNAIGTTPKGNTYTAALQANGTVIVSQNGTAINTLIWGLHGCAVTDSNPSGDTVTHTASGRTGDTAIYLQTLRNS